MKTVTKIDRIKNFLSTKSNVLFRVNSDSFTLSVLFDVEFSKNRKKIDFSKCLKVNDFGEAINILEKIVKNISKSELTEKLTSKLEGLSLNKNDCFYLIIKGNRLIKKKK